jgi:hypothetical protein
MRILRRFLARVKKFPPQCPRGLWCAVARMAAAVFLQEFRQNASFFPFTYRSPA